MRIKIVAVVAALSMISVAALVPSVMALPPATWHDGDEVAITGHSFGEEYWTADISNTTGGATATVTMSYVNHNDAQAFLLAFKTYQKEGNVSTFPYQLFGMHYTSADKRDIFLGAVLAFLMAFNDTYNGTGPGQNGLPDPDREPIYYIVPFGVGGTLTGGVYVPEVSAVPAQKLGDGHYRFGMTYKNLYAKIVDATNPIALILSHLYPIYIAKFSELTITYDVTYGANNTLVAQTFYTLGQVTKLWLWGVEVDPHLIPDNWGIAVVHYLAMFGSTYLVTGSQSGATINPNIQKPINEDIDIKVGEPPRRVFDIGFRGTFDVINETTGTVIRANQNALNVIVRATPWDIVLILWQAAFSLGVMTTMAYALSPSLRSRFTGPLDMFQNGSSSFLAASFWYAVSFPGWKGYRVVHDPVYTAYIAPPAVPASLIGLLTLMFLILVIVIVVAVVVAVAASRKGKAQPPQMPPR